MPTDIREQQHKSSAQAMKCQSLGLLMFSCDKAKYTSMQCANPILCITRLFGGLIMHTAAADMSMFVHKN